MKHSHVTFYQNSQSANEVRTVNMGGTGVVPVLNDVSSGNRITQSIGSGPFSGAAERSAVEKHAAIVEYLQQLPGSMKASFVDIGRELRIDLNTDIQVLGILKSNPRIIQELVGGELFFKYRARYAIKNKTELCNEIVRHRHGIILEDIKACYEGIEADCRSLIVGGDVIAVKNKRDFNSLILYPRGRAFLTKLSGTVTATPGEQLIRSSDDVRGEVRRGEAIQVGEFWYRIGSAIGSGAAGEQVQRAAAPTSVTLDKEMSDRNVYCDPFTHDRLPLDGDFEAQQEYSGPCYRHGCTSDIKQCWAETADVVKRFLGEEERLHQELVSLNLLSSHTVSQSATAGLKKHGKQATKRKQTRRRTNAVGSGNNGSLYGVNHHLHGTELERILKETREKAEREEMQSQR